MHCVLKHPNVTSAEHPEVAEIASVAEQMSRRFYFCVFFFFFSVAATCLTLLLWILCETYIWPRTTFERMLTDLDLPMWPASNSEHAQAQDAPLHAHQTPNRRAQQTAGVDREPSGGLFHLFSTL